MDDENKTKKDKGKIIIIKTPDSTELGDGDVEKQTIEPLVGHFFKGKTIFPASDPQDLSRKIPARYPEKIPVVETDKDGRKIITGEKETGRQITEINFEGEMPEGVDEIIIKKEKEGK